MRLILHLITLAAIISYCSISALKCYKCTDPEKNVQSSMGHKWLCYSITLFEHLSKKSIGMFTIWVDKEELQNISYGLTELLSSFCSNTDITKSWEKVDCAGSCVKYYKWKYQKIILKTYSVLFWDNLVSISVFACFISKMVWIFNVT